MTLRFKMAQPAPAAGISMGSFGQPRYAREDAGPKRTGNSVYCIAEERRPPYSETDLRSPQISFTAQI